MSGARRFWRRVAIGCRLAMPLAVQALLAVLVLRNRGPEVWGAYLRLALPLQLGVMLSSWGSRDFLLREFSAAPARASELARQVLLARVPLVLVTVLAIRGLGWGHSLPLCACWLVGGVLCNWADSVFTWRKRWVAPLVADCMAVLCLASAVWLFEPRGVQLAAWMASYLGARALVAVFLLRATLVGPVSRPGVELYLRALPTQALGLLGLLNSRVDQYAVALLESTTELARYQVLLSLLLTLQALPTLGLSQMVGAVGRLPEAGLRRLRWRLTAVGLTVGATVVVVLPAVMDLVFGLRPSSLQRLLAGPFLLASFVYLPSIWRALALHRDRDILHVGAVTAVLFAAATWLLTPRWGSDGALCAALGAQWVAALGYWWVGRRRLDEGPAATATAAVTSRCAR